MWGTCEDYPISRGFQTPMLTDLSENSCSLERFVAGEGRKDEYKITGKTGKLGMVRVEMTGKTGNLSSYLVC